MSEEFIVVTSDVVGFWDLEGVLTFRPTSKKIFRNKKFTERDSIMIVGVALAEATLIDSEGDEVLAQPGDTIGVWYSPGMRELFGLADCKVKMKADGEKDVGKGNPMKAYKIARAASDLPKPLPTSYDYRRQSPARSTADAPASASDEDYGDVPF